MAVVNMLAEGNKMSVSLKSALVVEDNDETAELESRVLQRMGMSVYSAGTSEDALSALTRQLFSIVLLDHMLPDGESWPVLDAARKAPMMIPVIMVTGMGDERVAAEALHRGASDYVVKTGNFWEKLPLIVMLAIKQSEKDRTKAHLASIVEFSPDAIVSLTSSGTIQSWNGAAALMFGCSQEEAVGSNFLQHSAIGITLDLPAMLARLAGQEIIRNFETVRTGKGGAQIQLSLMFAPVKNDRDKVIGCTIFFQDVTERNARRNAEQAGKATREFLANI